MSGPIVPVRLDRMADRADYAVIGPVDGRYRVPDARRAPYASVCHVQRDFGDGRLSGCTGFLIAPTVVVTAGHCVFSHKRLLTGRRAAPARIRVTPGRNGAVAAAPFGSQWAVRWYVNRHFAARADRQCDYGVVVLRRPFIRLRIGFRLAPQSDAAIRPTRSRARNGLTTSASTAVARDDCTTRSIPARVTPARRSG
jgi:glutamyl endopeptidase